MRRILGLVLLAAVAVGAYSSGGNDTGQGPAKKVTIRLAHNWTGADVKAPVWEGKLKEWAQQRDKVIDLRLEGTPGNDLREKILVQLAGNDLPDAFMYWCGAGMLKPFADADALIPVSTLMTKTKAVDLSKYSDVVLANTNINNKPYGVPVEIWYGYFLANERIFSAHNQKIPQTWDELLSVSKVFRDKGIVPVAVGSAKGYPGVWFFVTIVNQFADGVKLSMGGAESSFQFSADPTLKAARAIAGLKKDNFLPSDARLDYGQSLALYNEGKAAMVLAFSWMTASVPTDIAAASVVIPIPKLEATCNPNELSGSNGMAYYVTKKAWAVADKQPQLAALADIIASDEMTLALAKLGIPMAKTVKLDPASMNPLYAKAATWAAGKPLYTLKLPPSAPEVNSVYLSSMDELFAGIISGDEFVKKVQDAMDKAKK